MESNNPLPTPETPVLKKRGRPPKPKLLVGELVPVEPSVNLAYLNFVQVYLSNGGNASKAAKAAGFSASYGKELIHLPAVVKELALVRERLRKATDYGAQEFFAQGQRLLAEAEASGQMIAAARFYELSGKVCGLLEPKPVEKEKLDMRGILGRRLERGRKRAGLTTEEDTHPM